MFIAEILGKVRCQKRKMSERKMSEFSVFLPSRGNDYYHFGVNPFHLLTFFFPKMRSNCIFSFKEGETGSELCSGRIWVATAMWKMVGGGRPSGGTAVVQDSLWVGKGGTVSLLQEQAWNGKQEPGFSLDQPVP